MEGLNRRGFISLVTGALAFVGLKIKSEELPCPAEFSPVVLSGIKPIDTLTGGFRRGRLTTFLARSGHLKSTIADAISRKNTLLHGTGYTTAFWPVEEFLSRGMEVDWKILYQIIEDRCKEVEVWTVTQHFNANEIVKTYKSSQENNLELIVVDGLDLVNSDKTIFEMMMDLRGLAEKYNVAAVVTLPSRRLTALPSSPNMPSGTDKAFHASDVVIKIEKNQAIPHYLCLLKNRYGKTTYDTPYARKRFSMEDLA